MLHLSYPIQTLILLIRNLQCVQAIIISSCVIGNVPGRGGIVQLILVDDAVEDGAIALVDVRVAWKDEINTILDQERFEDAFACPADSAAHISVRDVPRSMPRDNGP